MTDSTSYYSCNGDFMMVDKAVDCRRGAGSTCNASKVHKDHGRAFANGISHSPGTDN